MADMQASWRRHPPHVMFRLLFLAISVTAGQVQAAEKFAATVSYVSDGDTLWVQPHAGGPPRKLRIDGIDAPEICQTGGEAARHELARRALRRPVMVTVRRHDSYGRGLARIVLDGRDLGADMVDAGHAWSYRWRHNPGPYAAHEARARQAGRGLLALEQAERPRDFRQRHGSCDRPRQ